MGGEEGQTRDEGQDPGDPDDQPAVGLRPPDHGLDGEDDGQEAVQGHEDQRVDRDVRGLHDQELDQLAPVEERVGKWD